MEVFFINLARRHDRRDRFLRANSGIADFRRAEAVDGRSLDRSELVRTGDIVEPLEEYSPGALGCAVSHKQLWELSVASATVVTVAEDDAVFNRHFVARASSLLAKLPTDWDLVLWGWNFDSVLQVEILAGLKDTVMHFDATYLGERLTEFQSLRYDVQPLRLISSFGLVCYSVSPHGARRLKERCFPLRQELVTVSGLRRNVTNFGIDVLMNKYYRELQAYVCFPPLVWTENDKATSDISV